MNNARFANARDRLLGRVMERALDLPDGLLRRVAGPPRQSDRGSLLDLQVQAMLAMSQPIRRPMGSGSVRRARAEMEWQSRLAAPALPTLAKVEDGALPGPEGPVAYRLYVPRVAPEPLPLVVFFHGGGWVVGSLQTHDAPCRMLAVEADCNVLSIDYRLAPEHPYPAGRQDAVAAYRWALANAGRLGADPERVAVAGDSAGGNLAALVCLEARRAGEQLPTLQLLIYPGTDLTRSCPSHRLFAEGLFLDDESMEWFLSHYLRNREDARDPRCSPLFEGDLSGLPRAQVVTAGFDPLRDEGEAYANKLEEAGVPVELRCEERLVHGFFNMGGLIRAADAASRAVAHRLRSALHR